ncbi:hypothetical protein TREMEDRAFT_20901, partial [Tremella mesenterica DSM 1558]|uniref:uncharacterized protein n=1 Tax=Tremella mesenterica (strain ATCC 24925 / CBS 8224 / DSM 1558 / NBRC 9311 / NRRL Y-6157 / RJB 2259-6 / UBC 559-6) TaxID=578456 RepID=UPI0003F499B4
PFPTPTSAEPVGTPRKRPMPNHVSGGDVPNFDEAFDDTQNENTTGEKGWSRESFLVNEHLRTQREARNFVYEGSADAPKLTRSGRVLGSAVDEYGAGRETPDEDERSEALEEDQVSELDRREEEHLGINIDEERDARFVVEQKINPLPQSARKYVLDILANLNGRNVREPAPFIDEEKNEALQGLVGLLKGTVERGEGNSALVVGPRGVGKTRTIARALQLLPSSSTPPIVVHLSGHAQTTDRLAIREMGRQISEAEGRIDTSEDDDDPQTEEDEYAPTTLPSHLLALLTVPSPRAIVIVIEEFDLFTEHARQALLYCLLDVVQSIKTGPVESTGRGVAVIGLTTRIDTLLLLEKRVKSRFSHRVWKILSPLSPGSLGWRKLLRGVLVPWELTSSNMCFSSTFPTNGKKKSIEEEDEACKLWKGDWAFAIETLLEHPQIIQHLDRLTGLTTDVRNVYRPFIIPVSKVLAGELDFISVQSIAQSILDQIEGSGWGLQLAKLKGLPHPALTILIICKHLISVNQETFNLTQITEEYLRFSRTRLVGSGKTRWPIPLLKMAFEHLERDGLLLPVSKGRIEYKKMRCTLSAAELAGWFRLHNGAGLGNELTAWGKTLGGH